MVDNKAKSKDLNQIFDDFVKERLGCLILMQKTKIYARFLKIFVPENDAKEMPLTPHSSVTPCKSMVLRASDYRITGLHPKLCPLPPKSPIFSFFIIIYKYLYI